MSNIVKILNYEEGYKERPYIDTEGYPTVACGVKIGPKGASLSNYIFTVPREVGDVWLESFVASTIKKMNENPLIISAMKACNQERKDILISMAYQMGVQGLAGFKNTLAMVSSGNFSGAASGMLSSKWAKQTPNRANRHAEVMRTGTLDAYKGVI
ncbi:MULTISPECIES: glycoside hydrolase family protein [Citrobacter]|jgi:lysozyme|uniref:glycoside hydrolase family protein n=1 Tax=Citrobacter TaxID=544 RepID=UPI000C78EA71|nr:MULTISPECIES: glycoside hydrolase family protein [Citrobacter]EAM8301900.1 lysozyme [Salmonella enterica]EAQ5917901.1 lysozyme [Salmonella enterica subsp. enterica serovar Inverness]EDO5296871.1 lysozyme [Salmonella enterica subsp. houtenae serovar 40:z4,z24:-]HCA3674604.1 glycoside hydrolase family protein [Salmonella enterica subsp. houtenae serovar Houten]EAQ5751457.1 lysozyme [Salmonella enterica]